MNKTEKNIIKIPKVFTVNTPFYLFEKFLINTTPCINGLGWCSSEEHKSKPFGEAMECYVNDENADAGWLFWWFETHYNVWDSKLREMSLEKIDNPMFAFQMYIKLENLSDKEEKILERKFKNKIPEAEKELKDGKIKRKINNK